MPAPADGLGIGILALLLTSIPCTTAVAADYFGDAQAARGEQSYFTHCSACHGVQLEGKSSVPLSGDTFKARWADMDLSVEDLLYIVRSLMPYGAPDSLPKSEYLDIVTYILKSNGYPGGQTDLPPDRATLSTLKLRR